MKFNLFDTHDKILKNSRFLVFIGIIKISFARVTGLEQNINKEFISEGGVNDYGHLLVVPSKEQSTMKFERGVQRLHPVLGGIGSGASLPSSVPQIPGASPGKTPTGIRPGVRIPAGITIVMLNNNSTPVHVFHIDDVVVTKWDLGEIDANSERVLIENFEVSYSKLERLNIQVI